MVLYLFEEHRRQFSSLVIINVSIAFSILLLHVRQALLSLNINFEVFLSFKETYIIHITIFDFASSAYKFRSASNKDNCVETLVNFTSETF